jgi:Legume lectin domain/Chitobiase/beta-hexosaminidase C-terminal domain
MSAISSVISTVMPLPRHSDRSRIALWLKRAAAVLPALGIGTGLALAQAPVTVTTAHNDIARTGQNLNETILTPGNVNAAQFGQLFTQTVVGLVYAQPLYLSQVAIPGKGTHNVVYIATQGDYVYAFDADTNGGVNGNPLWQVSLLTNTTPAGTYKTDWGVLGTPVIDPVSGTLYLVSSEVQSGSDIFRLHALDVTTGAEKFGGPFLIQTTAPGTGSGSTGGIVTFNSNLQVQRPGLLLLNGVLYVGFASNNDEGAWHGWIFSFTAATLKEINVLCISPNGSGAGIWMGGAGLAAEVNNPAKPYGRMFLATGNGTFGVTPPYNNSQNYGMSMLDIDLSNGVMTIDDDFTPFDEAALDVQDGDLGSGGPVLLPTQTLASGATLSSLVEIGKSGTIYILNRNNLGGFNATVDQVAQEVQTPEISGAGNNWGNGVWGTEAYWNGLIYSGGSSYAEQGTTIAGYSFANGVLSPSAVLQSADKFSWPGPTPSISANGATGAILWAINTSAQAVAGSGSLFAYDATKLGTALYSSNTNPARDNPGPAVKFTVPTIANGKVYVGAGGQVSIYGLLADTQKASSPTITPNGATYTGTQQVTINDAIAGATIYYTTNGTTPTANSTVYTGPFNVSTNVTITAVASPMGYLQSSPTSAVFESTSTTANPIFSLTSNTYAGTQTLTITDSSPNAVIHYTLNGSTPTTASPVYTQSLLIPVSETVQAIAAAPGLFVSSVTSGSYTIVPVYTINFTQGFALAQGPMQFNGSTDLDDFRLQLTNGGSFESGSAIYAKQVNIQNFTTDFTFQLSNPVGDGMTFMIENVGPGALGQDGGGLGYAGIGKSVAIKFDLYNNVGEGWDSTGIYLDGAMPTLPAVNMIYSPIQLHSGDYMNVHMTYDGTNLNLTITDAITLGTFSYSFPVNIPQVVGGPMAYVGFTAGTGLYSSSQKVTYWTYTAGPPSTPNYPAGFDTGSITFNGGAGLSGTRLRLTDGGAFEARSAFFNIPVNVQQFTTSFNFQNTNAAADGFTFTIQNNSVTGVGGVGGNLGYGGAPFANSVAIKFDLFSNEGEGADSTGIYTDGVAPTLPAINLAGTGINLHSSDICNVQLTYNGTTLTVTITDTVTNATATQNYTINIPAVVGGPTAYMGFTGGDGGATAIQDILSWTYSASVAAPAPAPSYSSGFSAGGLTVNGGAALNGTRLRLTDGGQFEARSAFFSTPVNVAQFNTSFQFQLTNASADGFTFTIQDAGPTAIAPASPPNGGDLGYKGIPTSLAVKFDLFSNVGEGPDSTGLYTNGASPTLPAINLTPTGVNLHSGDIFNAALTYNGTTLTVVITDTVTGASATQTYTVNIPSIVGGSTAYVGFTAGSGGATAIQDILSWTYSVN